MTPTILLSDLSLKSLKSVLVVADTNNVTRAAKQLNRSQTAVSKAIQGVEQKIGQPLFDRSPTGMSLTPAGAVLVVGIKEAMQQLQSAADAYCQLVVDDASIRTNPVFSMNITYGRLRALQEVYRALGVKEAAKQTQYTHAWLYDSMHFLEQMLDTPLFERNALGNQATPFCKALVRNTRLAFTALQNALDEIASEDDIIRGKVTIAAFPSVRSYLMPEACVQVKRAHPEVHILLLDGMYRDMEWRLRSGEIDFLICAFYKQEQELPDDLEQVPLFSASLRLIVRSEHPLSNKPSPTADDLKPYSWILPPDGTAARRDSEALLSELGIENPHCQIEVYSYSMQRKILRHSDSIALSFEHQFAEDERNGVICALPLQSESLITIGFTQRKNTTLSAPARVFREVLSNLSEQAQHSPR